MSEPVPPGSPAAAVIAEEEALLRLVLDRLAAASIPAAEGGPAYDEELLALRDELLESKPEDQAPIAEQMARLEALAARHGRGRRAVPIDRRQPYFAHIRLREAATSLGRAAVGPRLRDVLIGKGSFQSRAEDGTVNIVDWRNAPVSRIYYRYEEGDEYEEEWGGRRLVGTVVARRNLSIRDSQLVRVGCPAGVFVRDAHGEWHIADEAMTPVLQGGQGLAARPPRPAPPPPGRAGRLGVHHDAVPRADKHLPEIAALIDAEQFELITRPSSGPVLIAGGAGSGKTTVALHRVAYLHFADPRRFRPGHMLVAVPTPALAAYVSGVLPALGVRNVAVRAVAAWAENARRALCRGLPAEYADDTPDAVAKVKKHPALLGLLEARAAEEAARTGVELAAAVGELPEGARVIARWGRGSDLPLVPRLRELYDWIARAEIPEQTRHVAETTTRRLGQRANDTGRLYYELITDAALLGEAFARAPDGLPVGADDLAATARWTARQLDDPRAAYEGIDEESRRTIDGRMVEEDEGNAGKLDREDDPLLLRLHQLLQGGLVAPDGREHLYSHMVVDEAQDLSPIELRVLVAACTPERSLTVCGDAAQRLVFDNSFEDWASHLARAGLADVPVERLRVSYRSTAEVMVLARAVLGPLAPPDEPLIARPGAPVELLRFSGAGEAVAFLAESLRTLAAREPTASTALITRHSEQARALHAALVASEVPALRLPARSSFVFAPGVDVVDVAEVKGLEYDYVVVLADAPSFPDAAAARHLLHIAVTRAAHQLWIVCSGAPSPLLPADLVERGVWA